MLALLALLALGACSVETRITLDAPESMLGGVVDSVAVLPFEREDTVAINESDLEQFRTALKADLASREGLRLYDEPPTQLPNTARLTGKLERFEVYDQSADGLLLRTLDLQAVVHVRVLGNGVDTDIRRKLTWQKVYAQGQPVPSMTFDLRYAARELMAQVAAQIHPPSDEQVLVIRDARVPGWESDLEERLMVKANVAATNRIPHRAEQWWSLVLYAPLEEAHHDEYRLSVHALRTLRAENVREELVTLLEEEKFEDGPDSLGSYLDDLKDLLGPENQDLIGRVLELSVFDDERAQVLLATAHRNLAALYGMRGRLDLQCWHLSQAFGYLPEEDTLNDWTALMTQRGMLSDSDSPEQLVMDYQRMPPPPDGRSAPGLFALNVMPAPAWQRIDMDAPAESGPSGVPDGLPQPVEVPPATQPQEASGGLPAVEPPQPLQNSANNPLVPLSPTPTQP